MTSLDRALRVVEMVALLSIVAVGAVWLTVWHHLRDRTPPAAPEPTPTAIIRLADLPAGQHASLAASPIASPTPVLPVNYRPIVTAQPPAVIALPTPAPQHATRISIPAIKVDAPVVHGVEPDDLKLGVGHYEGAVNPGERGNLVLAGHNDVYGEVFRYLSDLQPGDEVTVYTASREYRYVVRGWRLVEPTDVSVMEPTTGSTVTLISCYPYLIDTERIIVTGELVEG
ncbi:MAG: class D sortase [Chloroflexi bacterium]|nr:class D sortase [Chloroflexota bacterium]